MGSVVQYTSTGSDSYWATWNELLSFGCQPTSTALSLALMDYDSSNDDDTCLTDTVADWM